MILFDGIDGLCHAHPDGDFEPCPECPSRRREVVLVPELTLGDVRRAVRVGGLNTREKAAVERNSLVLR